MDDTRLLFFVGLFCLHSWPQNKNPSFNKNCLFIRFLPHPLQLKQCGQACQWNSPCDNPGESAVIVLPQVWQSWKRQKKYYFIFCLPVHCINYMKMKINHWMLNKGSVHNRCLWYEMISFLNLIIYPKQNNPYIL